MCIRVFNKTIIIIILLELAGYEDLVIITNLVLCASLVVNHWAMRKRGIPEAMVRAVMSLYEGAKTRVRVGLELSKEFEVKVGLHQESVFLPLFFAIVVDYGKCEKWFDVRCSIQMTWFVDKRDDGGTEGEVLEMKGSIREQGAEGEPREDKSSSEWGRS